MTSSTTSPTRADEPRRVTATEAHELLGAGRAALLDVREPAAYENARASGAVSVPHVSVQASGGRLPAGFSARRTRFSSCTVGEAMMA
jgi:rhodanese-related sulfurtransferase